MLGHCCWSLLIALVWLCATGLSKPVVRYLYTRGIIFNVGTAQHAPDVQHLDIKRICEGPSTASQMCQLSQSMYSFLDKGRTGIAAVMIAFGGKLLSGLALPRAHTRMRSWCCTAGIMT